MSGASVSSFASSAQEGSTAGGLRVAGPDGDDVFEETHTLQLGLFGVLYTVSKEKQLTSVKFAFFRLFLDFLQLWLLVVNPSYGWAINAKNRVWQVVSFIQLNSFLSARGYTFFLVLLYVFIGLLAVNLALSIWVAHAFSNNRFEYVWPIQFLRWFGLIFYQVLDIATLTLLLVTLDCNYFNVPNAIKFHNQEFPDIMCWSMPHIVHVGISVASIAMFFMMATCQVVSEMELNPLTRNYMAIAHTRAEGMGFAIKTIVTVASVTIATSTKALAVVYLFFFALLFYLNVKWVPFVYSALNYVRCASYSTVLYCSALLIVLAFGSFGSEDRKHQFQHSMTLAMWAGMAPAAAAGALACHIRLRHFNRYVLGRFRGAEPGTASKSIYRFTDAREVEIAARCCRRWVDEETLEPEAVDLSEQIIKAGMLQLPQDAQMIILYSSFLIDVQGSYQSGYTQLQTAKKQSPGLLERFAIFSREQEHTQKASGANNGGGDSAVDLVSYVEFQRNHRLVVRAHREALLAMRSFWGLLLRTNVNFNHLSKALHRIEVSVKAAERAYRGVLARHGSSARLVRLYGRFLETVKFDPWAASKWYGEADRLEEEAEHTKEALQLGGMETLLPQGVSAERGLAEMEGVAFICINAQSIIQVASPEAHTMLGYAKNELKGKDIGIVMPPPFGDRHSAYVRNYIQTGVSAILDRTNEMVLLTKTRQVLPVKLRVSKVSGLNEDSVFLGVLEALPPSPDEARAWVLGNGVIVAADSRFCDWLGYEGSELSGAALEGLLMEPEPIRDAIKTFSRPNAPAAAHGRLAHRRSSNFTGDQLMVSMPAQPGENKYEGKGNGGGGGANDKVSWLRHASFSVDHAGPSMMAVALTHVLHGGSTHGGGGGAGGGGGEPSSVHMPVALPRVAWRHKYSAPLHFDTFLQPGAFGSVKVHSAVIRRCSQSHANTFSREPASSGDQQQACLSFPSARPAGAPVPCRYGYDDLLLVADIKGRVLHVTAALAAALGRSVESILAGGLGLLIPEPASILHGPWLQELGNPMSTGMGAFGATPPYSCRSGVAVSLSTYSEQSGPGVKPFRLRVSQRLAEGGGSKIHIVSLTPLTLEQALSERRLRLSVNLSGTILSVDEATPSELFGADPRVLKGRSIAQIIDLFRPDPFEEVMLGHGAAAAYSPNSTLSARPVPAAAQVTGARGSSDGRTADGSDGDVLEGAEGIAQAAFARRLTKALLKLARRSSENPGCSWRVGVHVPPDEQAALELEQLAALLGPGDAELAAEFLGAKTVPAVMRVRLARTQRSAPAPAPQEVPPGAGADGRNAGVPRQSPSHVASRQQPPRHAGSGALGAQRSLFAAISGLPIAEGAVQHTDVEDFPSPRRASAGHLWCTAPQPPAPAALWAGRSGGRVGAGPVAEAVEPAADGAGAGQALMDDDDVAALEELADAIQAAPPLALPPPPPPAAPASAGAAALAAAVAAAADRSRHGSGAGTGSQRSITGVEAAPQGGRAGPPRQALPSVDAPPPQPPLPLPHQGSTEAPATPKSYSAALAAGAKAAMPQLALQLPGYLSPMPADQGASRPNAAALSGQSSAREEVKPRAARPGAASTVRPVSLRLPPEAARGAAAAAAATAAATAAAEDAALSALGVMGGASVGGAGAAAAATGVAPSLFLEIELWRADLLSGVLEVDEKGRVLRADATCPLGQSGLLLGCPPASLPGASVSDLVPLSPGGVSGLLEQSSGGDPASAIRGALKKRAPKQAQVGSAVALAARHASDGCELALSVQAVRRAGPSGSAFLLLRPSSPAPAQPGFMRWLYDGDTSGLMMPHDGGAAAGFGSAMPHAQASGLSAGDGKPAALSSAFSLERFRAATAAASVGGSLGGYEAAAGAGQMIGGGRKAATLTGISGMTVADHAASQAQLPGMHYSYSVTGIGAVDARLGQHQRPPLAALLAASGGLKAPPPPPPQLATPPASIDAAAVSPMRIAALRGAAGGSMPSRLSMISAPAPPSDGPEELAAADGADGNSAPRKSTSTGLSSSVVPDTAYEQPVRPGGPAERFPSLQRRPSSSDLAASAALDTAASGLKMAVSPRQSPALMRQQGEVEAVAAVATRPSSRLSPKKHNMVHSWVLNGHGHAALDQDGQDKSMHSSVQGTQSGRAAADSSSDGDSGGSHSDRDAPSANGADNGSDGGGSGGPQAAAGGAMNAAGTDESGRGTEQELESEAGALVANYSVGKRFKKLHKILSSPLAQQAPRRLRMQAVGALVAILMAHTVTFVLLLTQLLQQEAAVEDLNSVAMASRRVHEIAIDGRILDRIYAGNSYVEGAPQFGEPVDAALAEIYDDLTFIMSSLKELHHGVYLGFRSLRRMPTDFGLREIWDNPSLNVTLFYDANDPANPSTILSSGPAPTPSFARMGLWDAGNLYLAKALDMCNNGPSIVQEGGNFTNWSTWRFIHANGVSVIFPAYEATLDALVQLTVSKSKSIYNLQLIVLCLEGGLLCLMACTYVWYVASKFSRRRHSLYAVFIQIPLGVTRGLANMSLKLEATEDDEEDDGGLPAHETLAGDNGAGHPTGGGEAILTDGAVRAAANSHSQGNGTHPEHAGARSGGSHRRRNSTLGFSVKEGAGAGESEGGDAGQAVGAAAAGDGLRSGRLGFLSSAFGSLTFWRGRAKISPQQAARLGGRTRRRLVPSQRLACSLVAPFVLWGVAIVIVNLVGYNDLKSMTAPIATLNVVNAVLVRAHRMIFFVLEVAAAYSGEACDFYKSVLQSELAALQLEYSAMLYGNEVVPNSDNPHFCLATTGVVFGGFRKPAQLLYKTGGCLCTNPDDCQPPESPLYQVTHNGLDVLLKTQFSFIQSLVVQPVETSGLNSTEFKYIWETGQTDLEGGVSKMSSVFLDEVQGSYNKVVVQQVVMFCVAWVWGLAFLLLQLRPLLRKTHNEMRRIAELLSQLPGEVDCEALMMAVILGDHQQQGSALRAAAAAAGQAVRPSASGGGGSGNAGSTAHGGGASSSKFGRGFDSGIGATSVSMRQRNSATGYIQSSELPVVKESI